MHVSACLYLSTSVGAQQATATPFRVRGASSRAGQVLEAWLLGTLRGCPRTHGKCRSRPELPSEWALEPRTLPPAFPEQA